MQRFKKRLRLLTEKNGGTISYRDEDSLTFAFKPGTAHCELTVGNTFPVGPPKSFCFDIAARLAIPYLAQNLHRYQRG